ncbi:hypothetical protein NDK43_06935 [Neobacillus pocheonensis]|uniref:Uncharacterized protein n=1 Tax=Neobacillus pocheonensis TaxID=363869 RepID=A0ABT0W793_9BACI|nr:hypothetical protein [Neobacillus pocheonensis]
MINTQFNKQMWANDLGAKLVEAFTQKYAWIDYDPELIPEEIEVDGVKLQLSVNGHEDCPRYNAQVTYIGEVEEQDTQIWVNYYRSSVLQSITVMPMYEGPEYHFESFEYKLEKRDIIRIMKQLMKDEL